jgi:glycosyltransferase involved in cell wall biosynthesis
MGGTVHFLEIGGRGGVYQHTVGVAEALAATGVPVVIHTATDPELVPGNGVDLCRCMDWARSRSRRRRQATVVANLTARYVPHVLRSLGPGDLAHLQGAFVPPLLMGLIAAVHARRRPLVYSPHNTFARYLPRLFTPSLRWCARHADATIAFSAADQAVLQGWGVPAHLVDLVFHMPAPDPKRVAGWRSRFGDRPVALVAGQVRADKRPELLVSAVATLGGAVRAAVVGDDRGGGGAVGDTVRATGSDALVLDQYLDLDEFVALVAAADVVVCPYRVASVSGPLAFARVLGVRSVVTDAGGLSELATVTARSDSPGDLGRAITEALAKPAPDPLPYGAEAARQHLGVYRAAGWSP